ncbi:hypothetical protein ACS3UN_09980 [Oscillospiraceae bacterium LTW-04]|nr:hypothetical protein RBH76_11730 [Oscillospiraceae bacterium MB24-C1]
MLRIEKEAKTPSGGKVTLRFFEPDECPLCKKAIKPNFLYAYASSQQRSAYVFFECRGCCSAFVKAIQSMDVQNTGTAVYLVEVESTPFFLAPNPATPVLFSTYINDISPSFVKIYNEAHSAECANLSEIAGIGYRKAIEFLIKDYLISSLEESEHDKIKRAPLGPCIKTYIENPQLKIVAERAVWIGNDETHYIRKHENKDVQDLKRLIEVTVRWIEMELMTKEASDILPL